MVISIWFRFADWVALTLVWNCNSFNKEKEIHFVLRIKNQLTWVDWRCWTVRRGWWAPFWWSSSCRPWIPSQRRPRTGWTRCPWTRDFRRRFPVFRWWQSSSAGLCRSPSSVSGNPRSCRTCPGSPVRCGAHRPRCTRLSSPDSGRSRSWAVAWAPPWAACHCSAAETASFLRTSCCCCWRACCSSR